MLSRRRAMEPPDERLMDTIEIWNIMLPPVIWWLSGMSPAPKMFFGDVFLISLPPVIAVAALTVHWVIHLVYVVTVVRRVQRTGVINWGKYSLMGATWVWFYCGLVIDPTTSVFTRGIMTVHALPYLLFTQQEMAKPQPQVTSARPAFLRLGLPLAFAACVLIFGIALHNFGRLTYIFFYKFHPGSLVGLTFHIPLLTHYYFDSFIWKRGNWLPKVLPA